MFISGLPSRGVCGEGKSCWLSLEEKEGRPLGRVWGVEAECGRDFCDKSPLVETWIPKSAHQNCNNEQCKVTDIITENSFITINNGN